MSILLKDCIYEIFIFLDSTDLSKCSSVNKNFENVYKSEQLWKCKLEGKYKEIFKKGTWFETFKVYHGLNLLIKNLRLNYKIEELFNLQQLSLSQNQIKEI